jgi:hypothetical protein
MAGWHAARNVPVFYIVIEINQLLLEISNGMPISRNNTLAVCKLLVDV